METPMHKKSTVALKPQQSMIVEVDEPTTSATKPIQREGKNNASLHGISYQLRLGLVILLRLYKMHKMDDRFDFELAFEDPQAGKFDDVVVRYSSSKDSSKGIVRMQAKHKRPTYIGPTPGDQQKSKPYETISEADLLSTKKKGQFSISMYFDSFIKIHRKISKETQNYIICTNKTLDKRVPSLIQADLEDSYISSFLRDINVTFYKFDRVNNMESLDEILKGVAINKGYTEVDSLSIIQAFYDNFILACGSVNESELHDIAIKLLIQLVDFQHVTTYEKLHMSMFEAINKGPKCFKPSDVEEMFKQTESGHILEYFRVNTTKHVETLREKYFDLKLKLTAVEETNLFKFLQRKTLAIHWYYSSCGTEVSILVLEQIVKHAGYEMVLLDYSAYKDVVRHITATASTVGNKRVSKVDNFPQKLISITTQGQTLNTNEFTRLAAAYGIKFIIIEPVKKDEKLKVDKTIESFSFGDLSKVSRDRLSEKKVNRFGTSVTLRKIIKQNDPFLNLFKFLGMDEERSKSLHEARYEKIDQLYVGRHFRFYEENTKANENHMSRSITFDDNHDIPGLVDGNNFCKVNIIVNDAGTGKSTLFTKLSWRLSSIIESSYVIRINAFIYSTDFKRLQETYIDKFDIIEVLRILFCFIHLYVHEDSKIVDMNMEKKRRKAQFCAELLAYSNDKVVVNEHKAQELNLASDQLFELRLFTEKINENLVILLLDGFDEIAPDYKQVVLKCFSQFAKLKGIRHIYLSSRPYHFISEFRQTFPGCRMYQLRPFSEDDRKNALCKYIRHEMTDYEKKDQQIMFNALMQDLKTLPEQLLSVPLFLRMAFEIRFPVIQKTVSSFNEKKIKEAQSLNILQLIEAFVEKKVQRRYLEKRGIHLTDLDKPGESKKIEKCLVDTKNQHALLAMFAIFKKQDRKKLLNDDEERKAFAYMEKTKFALEKTGIIVGVRDGIPQFILRILAEYFAALWFYENIIRFENADFVRSKLFWTEELQIIRDFMDRMLLRDSDGCKMHQAILDDELWIRDFLQHDPLLAQAKDNAGRMPLHMAAARHLESYKMDQLLEKLSLESINAQDKLYQWSALDYAFVSGNWMFAEMLMKQGATLSLETLFQQICSNNLRDLLLSAHNYAEWLQSHANTNSNVEQLMSRVLEYLVKERQINIYFPYEELDGLTVFRFCVEKDIVGVIKQLFAKDVEQAKNPPVGIFKRFYSKTIEESQNSKKRLDVLLTMALMQKSNNIVLYLIDDCNIMPLPHLSNEWFVCALNLLMKANRMNNFKKIFNLFYAKLNIHLRHDKKLNKKIFRLVDLNLPTHNTNIHSNFPTECCEHISENIKSMTEQDDLLDEHFTADLIARAVYHGNVSVLHYIIEKTKTKINNRLVVKIMRLLPKFEYVCHEKSIPAFNYLLERTTDLDSVDEEGRNLLHMTAQTGCFYMLHCLIVKGFDPTLINKSNGWNVLQYASCYDRSNSAGFKRLDGILEYFMFRRDWFHFLYPLLNSDILGENENFYNTDMTKQKTHNSKILNNQQHALLGMLHVFKNDFKNKMVTEEGREEVIALVKQVEHGEVTSRLIHRVIYDIPIFRHYTFAEYFAACWLYENKNRMGSHASFRTQSFWRMFNSRTRDFFDRFALKESKGCEIHLAVLNQSEKQVSKLLLQTPSLALVKDALGRIPLHLASSDILHSIEKKLLECMPPDSINARDELFQWSALDYAFVTKNQALIKILLDRGAVLNIDNLLHQICSNDLRDLLATGHDYGKWMQSDGNAKEVADQLRSRVVEYLIKDLQIDCNIRSDELDQLSVLEFCMREHYVAMFDQLVQRTIGASININPLPLLHYTCGNDLFRSFQIIFQLLCQNHDIPLVDDAQMVELRCLQYGVKMPKYYYNNDIKFCCVRSSNNARLSFPESDEGDVQQTDYVLEILLSKAVHHGTDHILHYIIQKAKITVTNKLIVKIMRLLPKYEYVCHEKSIPAFNYLLERTTDLDSVDEDGRNLLHMTAQNGCSYMLQCLIVKGFNPTLVNAKNGWNVLHYATYNGGDDRLNDILNFVIYQLDTQRFDLLHPMLSSDDLSENENVSNAVSKQTTSIFANALQKQQLALLGMLFVFKEECKDNLFTEEEHDEGISLVKQIEQGEKNSTIIKVICNGIPIFNHYTFAEYFAACWLYENKGHVRSALFIQKLLFCSNRAYEGVYMFFNRFASKDLINCQIHLAILNQSQEQVTKLLLETPSLALVKDAVGRLPLHLAASYSLHSIVEKLLEYMPPDSINARDELFHWRALDYAFITKNQASVKMLVARH